MDYCASGGCINLKIWEFEDLGIVGGNENHHQIFKSSNFQISPPDPFTTYDHSQFLTFDAPEKPPNILSNALTFCLKFLIDDDQRRYTQTIP
jgi:hypothetical protein